jgi:pimeloyl-ACP methyl ester carboxylesterase
MLMISLALLTIVALYLLVTLLLTYVVHQVPRAPVQDPPNWGRVTDTRIPVKGGGELEVWRVEPEGVSKGTILLAHGWSRNRDRMMGRARLFGKMGFTTVLHSARDHGNSSRHRWMNALRFAQDIETVMDWIDEPILLYGHSIGAAAAVIVASRKRERIRLLFLEGCYARTREALFSLYRNQNRLLGPVLAPMVLLWMDLFYRFRLDTVSPVKLAPSIHLPVLIIHGGKDQNFPLHHAQRLRDSFPPGMAELFVSLDADHSSSSLDPDYPQAIRSFLARHLTG